ncbi:TPA: AsnC family protein [Salmonella enterica]|nr:AsnC family protein [Salmonella enterica]
MILPPMATPGKCPAHVREWTPEEEELLISLYPSMTIQQIATVMGRGVSAIGCRVSLLRNAGRLSYKQTRLTPEQRRFIRDNRRKMTVDEVAAAMGISRDVVDHNIRAMNISYRKYGDEHPLKTYPDSYVELIRQLRDEYNLTFTEIGEKFDLSRHVCRYLYARRMTADYAIAREYLPR